MATTRIQKLHRALAQLAQAQVLFEKSRNTDLYESMRNSLIKCFEFSYELLWKCLKDYLYERHNIVTPSPKSTFTESFNTNIVSLEEFNAFIDMIGDRNNTTHAYDELLAEAIAGDIPKHYVLMNTIAQRLFTSEFSRDNKSNNWKV